MIVEAMVDVDDDVCVMEVACEMAGRQAVPLPHNSYNKRSDLRMEDRVDNLLFLCPSPILSEPGMR